MRLTIISILTVCFFLYKQGLTDYVILLSVVIFFGGVISISNVEILDKAVRIRKSYFWGLLWLRKDLPFDQLVSINRKTFLKDQQFFIESPENSWFEKDPILSVQTVLTFRNKGAITTIEIQIDKKDFRDIAWIVERKQQRCQHLKMQPGRQSTYYNLAAPPGKRPSLNFKNRLRRVRLSLEHGSIKKVQ